MSYRPRVMYLAHFGRLDDPAGSVERLRRSIRDLAAIALAEEDSQEERRLERLKQAVGAYLTVQAYALGIAMGDAALRELLALDIDFNAQGLKIWLVRRLRRRKMKAT